MFASGSFCLFVFPFSLKQHVMNSFCLRVLAGCQCKVLTVVVSQCLWTAEPLGSPRGLTDDKITESCQFLESKKAFPQREI